MKNKLKKKYPLFSLKTMNDELYFIKQIEGNL